MTYSTLKGNITSKIKNNLRGVMVAILIGLSAAFLGNYYAAPVMLFALLLGLSFNFLSHDSQYSAGLNFSATSLLKIGVALLGSRISFNDLELLGWQPLAMVFFMVVFVILLGVVSARIFKIDSPVGLLTAGAVAICGASAAAALVAVLSHRIKNNQIIACTIIGVTSLSSISMILYPIISDMFHLSDRQAGFFIGSTIHDVAQVIGAGYSISEESGDVATITKLFRVFLLVPIVFTIAIIYRKKDDSQGLKLPIPGFLVIFAILMLANSFKLLSPSITEILGDLSRWFLVFAIAAVGTQTRLKDLAGVGKAAMLLIVGETVILFVIGLSTALILL